MNNITNIQALTRNQAYTTFIEGKIGENQERISDLATNCFAMKEKPEGFRGALRYATQYLFKSEEESFGEISQSQKVYIERKLHELDELFEKAHKIIIDSKKTNFTIACDLLNIHYDILIAQWEILEKLHDAVGKNTDAQSKELQKNIHSLLKDVIIQIGQETKDPLLSNEEVVSQIINHHAELSQMISDVKQMLAKQIHKDVDMEMVKLGDKILGEKGHQIRFQAQMYRVERWRLENQLALELQQKLPTVSTKNPLIAQRGKLLDQLRNDHDMLKQYKKEMREQNYSIPTKTDVIQKTQEVWMLSDYGRILLEKDPNDLYQETFDESFRQTLSSLKAQKKKLTEEKEGIKNELKTVNDEFVTHPEYHINPTKIAKKKEIEERLDKKEQELKTATMMIRYTVLKRTMDKIADYQRQLNQTTKELPKKIEDYQIAQASLYLYQKFQENIEKEVKKPNEYEEMVWNQALLSHKKEIWGLPPSQMGQLIDLTEKNRNQLNSRLEEEKATYVFFTKFQSDKGQFKRPANISDTVWKKIITKLNIIRNSKNLSYEGIDYAIGTAAIEINRLTQQLQEADTTLYLHKRYNENLHKSIVKPEHLTNISEKAWKQALSELIRLREDTSTLSPNEIKQTIAYAQKNVERLQKEVKNSETEFRLLPEKLETLNTNFRKQLGHYERLWTDSTKGFVIKTLNSFWNKLKGKLSLWYLSEPEFPSIKEIQEQHHFANLGYSMSSELYKLYDEVKTRKMDYTKLGNDFLDWAQRHPEVAGNIASNFVQAVATFSSQGAALDLASSIKTKVLLYSVIRQVSLIRPDSTEIKEKDIESELKFRAIAQMAGYAPMMAQAVQTAQSGIENYGQYGLIVGGIKTFFSHAVASAKQEVVQQTVTDIEATTAIKALRFASYVDYVFLSNAYIDSAVTMQNLTLTNQVIEIFDSLKTPKEFMKKIGNEISHWWKRLTYSKTWAAKLAHAAPAAATVGVVALTIAAFIGGPITLGIAITAWGLYLPFIFSTYPWIKATLTATDVGEIENRINQEDVLKEMNKKATTLNTKIEELIDQTMKNLKKHKLIPKDLTKYQDKMSTRAKEYLKSSEYVSIKSGLELIANKELKAALDKKRGELKNAKERKKVDSSSMTVNEILFLLRDNLLFTNYKECTQGSEEPKTFRKLITDTVNNIEGIEKLEVENPESFRKEISVYLYADLMNYIATTWLTDTIKKESYDKLLEDTQQALLKGERPVETPIEATAQAPETQVQKKLANHQKILQAEFTNAVMNDTTLSDQDKQQMKEQKTLDSYNDLFSLNDESSFDFIKI